jgi:hypothetical protein
MIVQKMVMSVLICLTDLMYLHCPVGCFSLFKRGWWGAVLPGQVPKLTVQVGPVQM